MAIARVWELLVSTGPRKARRLASGDDARPARHAAEARLRAMAIRYDQETPLTLRLLVIEDHCLPGGVRWEWLKPVRDDYKVLCRMRLTAYYTSPHPLDATIDAILTAGDQPLSGIPFTHEQDGTETELIPGSLGDRVQAGHVLGWDNPGRTLPEPKDNPCLYRRVYEPPHASLTAIRHQHGSIFRLALPPEGYYRIPR